MDEIENLRRAVHKELLDATRYAIPAESDLAELRRDVAHHGVRLAIELAREPSNLSGARIAKAQSGLVGAIDRYSEERLRMAAANLNRRS